MARCVSCGGNLAEAEWCQWCGSRQTLAAETPPVVDELSAAAAAEVAHELVEWCHWEDAAEVFERAAPQRPERWLEAAALWLDAAAPDRALACANQALAAGPNPPAARLRAEALARLASIEAAEEALAQLGADADADADAEVAVARAHIELNRNAALAVEHAERAVEHSNEALRRAWRALLAAKVANQQRSLADAERAASLWPLDRGFQLRLGIEQRLAGDVEGAATTLARLLERVPQHRAARVQLLECQSALPKFRRATHVARFAADVQQWWVYLVDQSGRPKAPSILGDQGLCRCETLVEVAGNIAARHARLHLAPRHERAGSVLFQCPATGLWWHGHVRFPQGLPALVRIDEVPAATRPSSSPYL